MQSFRGDKTLLLVLSVKMEIKSVKIEALKPFEKNPRKITTDELSKLATSIKEFGFVEPVVVNKGNTVIGGHQRLKAAKLAGLKSVPCYYVDLSPKKATALNIALNKISGEWDEENLVELLAEMDNDIFPLTGFDDKELEDLIKQLGAGDIEPLQEDPLGDVPKRCEKGHLWQLGDHRLLCGDATSKPDVDRLMGGQKADMVFTDPLYGVSYEQGKFTGQNVKRKFGRIENDNQNEEKLYVWINDVFKKVYDISKDGCPIYVFSASMTASLALLTGVIDSGWHIQSQLIWLKNHFILGRCDYHWQHELLWYGYKGKNHYWCGDRTQGTIWEQDRENANDYQHPTQKPPELGIKAIKNSSKKNDIILDFFGGSGSTLIACEQTKRKCFMMEIDPRYCDVIIQRWENLTNNKAEKIKQ